MAANRTTTVSAQERQWFSIYKPTQGYWTRRCTAIGVGVMVLWGAEEIFTRLSVYGGTRYGLPLQAGSAVLWLAVCGALLYWIVGRKPTTVDFFIAVEGEMKKVNWSTRQEVIGATKVVMVFVVLMSAMLFVVDTAFMLFFKWIQVLRV